MMPWRITIHCSATKNGQFVSAAEIRKWHLAKGWSDIGYHLVIDVDGTVENGRGLNIQGAHVEGENEGNIGICMIGTDRFDPRQWAALRSKLDSILMIYPIKVWHLYCHNQFKSAIKQGKTCPGFDINTLLAWYIGHYEQAIASHLLEKP